MISYRCTGNLCIPTNQWSFDINHYITFTQGHTRSSTGNKLKHLVHTNNLNRNSYFHHLPHLRNALPVIDINLSIATIKAKLKEFMLNHFVDHFDDDNHCTYAHTANVTNFRLQLTFKHYK